MKYYNLSSYLREKYGKRMKKICIDGGFSCPNRDGKCGFGGCIFCGERGAGEHIDPELSITEQVRAALDGAPDDALFIAYFQNFTNTYAAPDVLRARYDAALIDDRIKILAIGTRPDELDRERVELIASYAERMEVWVELGLQTANDSIAKIINRGYPRSVFEDAMSLLSEYKIKTVVHLIRGLPTETARDFEETVDYLSRFDLFGIKLHSLYVMQGTRLAELYLEKRYTPPTEEEYLASAAYLLSHVGKNTVIHRLTGDCPDGMLLAPAWSKDKNRLLSIIQSM